mgnify:FL=1
MKKEVNFLSVLLLIFMVISFLGCKKEKITLSEYEFWFPGEAGVQNIQVTANCDWTISIDDGADWYSIKKSIDTTVYSANGSSTYFIIYNSAQTISSGRGSMTLAIVVEPLENQLERSSSFTITSAKGNVQLKVHLSQNTEEPTELESITDMVFGVANVAHWNVDYFGEVIEESYRRKEFNPYDTTSGYIMYFFQDSIGIQRDNVNGDSTTYYSFKYAFDPDARILHLEFETITDTSEIYNAPVLIATEELFRFQHEYMPMRWEISDMRKIGTLHPNQKTRMMRQATKKRKPKGGVFQF